jgi:hypothetical protein
MLDLLRLVARAIGAWLAPWAAIHAAIVRPADLRALRAEELARDNALGAAMWRGRAELAEERLDRALGWVVADEEEGE